MLLLLVAAVALTIATLLYQGVALLFAAQMPPIGPQSFPPDPAADVAVVIAARNEAEEIDGCLAALDRSTVRPREVVVVDGASTDGTPDRAAAHAGVRVIREPPLPAGWVGKNWGCHLGSKATTAPWMLFLDADVRIHPRALAAALGWAAKDRADLVSFGARIEMRGFWERVVMPFYTQMTLTYFRAPRTNRAGSRAAVANGQFYLIRRDAYDAVGGHAAMAGAVIEDIELARRLRAAGRTLRLGWAPQLVVTRMYRDRHEMFEGILKTAHDTRFSLGRQLAFFVGLVGFFLLPLALLPVGLWLGSFVVTALGALLWVALFGKHAVFSRAVGSSARAGLLFPVAVGFYLAVVATSIGRGVRRRPTEWKGRSYAPDAGPSGPGAPPSP